jgi:hypothetical protein
MVLVSAAPIGGSAWCMADLGHAGRLAPAQRFRPVTGSDLLVDAFERINGAVTGVVAGLLPEQLGFRPSPTATSIAWLIWHLTRVQDDQVATIGGRPQVWSTGAWRAQFALPFDKEATGFGHGPDEVAAVWVESGSLLIEYHWAVYAQAVDTVRGLSDQDLGIVLDEPADLPATVGQRLNAVASEALQRVGQAAYVRGLLEYGRT